jgi:hypothetical protein
LPAQIKKYLVVVLIAVLMIGIKTVWKNLGYLTRHSLEIQVVDLGGVPSTCGRPFLSLERSGKPNEFSDRPCGSIITNWGPFNIVEGGFLNINKAKRAEIVSMLKVGCSYQISYYYNSKHRWGYSEPHPGVHGANIVHVSIIDAKPTGVCGPLTNP